MVTVRSSPTSHRPPRISLGPKGSTKAAGASSRTWVPTRGKASSTCTFTCSAAARCSGHRGRRGYHGRGRPTDRHRHPTDRRRSAKPTTRREGASSPDRTEEVATATTQVKILVPGHQSMVTLLGQRDAFLKQIEVALPADVLVRGNEITITGAPEATEHVGRVFEELLELLEQGYELPEDPVRQTISMVTGAAIGDLDDEEAPRPSEVLGDNLLSARGKKIGPKTFGQKPYVDAIRRSTVTFAIGPAGTGKTYLAVAVAVRALQERQISRIILTRPAVEAGGGGRGGAP